jgi:toxin-antitoxin system PIN domain toxin
MLVIDANLLIYAYHAESAEHAAARAWLEGIMSGTEAVALPWLSILAFLRITTHQRIFERPLSMIQAQEFVASWLERPQVHAVEAGADFFAILSTLLASAQIKGAMVSDAALAALAIEHGATLYTTDRDFARFPGLKWVNPLLQD